MQHKPILLSAALCLCVTGTWAAAPIATPYGAEMPTGWDRPVQFPADRAFGDPGDFNAALIAAADYLVAMQADISEDNAGNGFDGSGESPDDPDDGGWDWVTSTFSHSTSPSPANIYGATAEGLYQAYLAVNDPTWFTALEDAADFIVADAAANIHTASDITFLLNFATLPGVSSPATYQAGAVAIWNWRITNSGGGTATGLAEYIRDARFGQSCSNGIIAWDVGKYAQAAAALDAAFPASGYDDAADDIAAVLWQDSFNATPGYFDPFGVDQGYDPTYSNTDYYWYSLGLTGLIDAFCVSSDDYSSELALLETTLLDCQCPSGSFSFSYGGNAGDEDWQSSGYAIATLATGCLTGHQDAINAACAFIGATQDPSGGFLYTSGDHYPEIAGENLAGLSFGTSDYTVTQSPAWQHIAENDGAAYVDRASVNYSLSAGTEAYRSITVFVDYDPSVLTPTAITQNHTPANSTFADNLGIAAGQLEITIAILGLTSGISGAANLFDIEFDGISDTIPTSLTSVHIAQVVMRDPVNQDIFAHGNDDVDIVVDDEAPTLGITWPGASMLCINGDFDIVIDADDNVDLDRVEYEFNASGTWIPAASGIAGASYDDGAFSVDVSLLGDGDHDIVVRCFDDVGYESLHSSWSFHLDTAAPVAATDLDAAPRDAAVYLSWTAGSGLDDYKLYRAKRASAYPYPGGLPAQIAWPDMVNYSLVATIAAGDTDYTDTFAGDTYATRGIYDYVLVSTDCVNADAATAPASATNYFLGDWADAGGSYGEPYDGVICFDDLNVLAGQYGEASNAGNEEMDVAPTDDMSRFGLPDPDAVLNFEDLIILAMNYRIACTTPLMQAIENQWAKDEATDASAGVSLSGSGSQWQLQVERSLLGLSVTLKGGELLSASCGEGFLAWHAGDGEATVDLVGLGELLQPGAVIQLQFSGDAAPVIRELKGRDAENGEVLLSHAGTPLDRPQSFGLEQNHPNPFNPATVIRYSLAEAAPTQISVYNTTGQLVRRIDCGTPAAGSHELRFDGSGLASGVYIYRLEAGSFSAQKKMVLVK